MIKIDGEIVNLGSFPDGTLLVKYDPKPWQKVGYAKLSWYYENDGEFLALAYLTKHLRANGVSEIYLYMPYIPNARQDRVKTREDVFTLKYFAEMLNSLKFNRVEVLDPHSSVSEALIDNILILTPEFCIGDLLDKLGSPIEGNIMMFYPDEGAMKRYSGMVKLPYAFGIKKRDWATGTITGLDVAGEVESIAGKDILIVDDICSRGGTFLHSAKKLKELGANNIYLFISHCENTILEGELLTSGLIEKVYTMNSIFTKNHEKIEVLK